MLLYDSRMSGNCYKVRLLLAHLGLSYARRDVDVVDRSERQELLGDLNPALRIPTVVLDDGRPLAESNAILTYFAEGTEYLPSDITHNTLTAGLSFSLERPPMLHYAERQDVVFRTLERALPSG